MIGVVVGRVQWNCHNSRAAVLQTRRPVAPKGVTSMRRQATSPETWFATRVERGPGCWLWTGKRQRHFGYGLMPAGKHQTWVFAHRAAWELASGELIPNGMVIGHTCDTPACVRNDERGVYVVNGKVLPRWGHLFLGTPADNLNDMRAKGRWVRRKALRGDENPSRRHPERLARGDRSGSRLHPERVPRGERHPNVTISDVQLAEFRRRCELGESPAKLAREFGVGKTTAYRWARGTEGRALRLAPNGAVGG